MDWLADFTTKFKDYPELQHLKKKRFYGSIKINFHAGEPKNYDYMLHRQSISNTSSNGSVTLTKGD